MVVLQVHWYCDTADGDVGVVKGCIRDDGDAEEDAGRDEEECGSEIRPQ